jgi:hypothetical protein
MSTLQEVIGKLADRMELAAGVVTDLDRATLVHALKRVVTVLEARDNFDIRICTWCQRLLKTWEVTKYGKCERCQDND